MVEVHRCPEKAASDGAQSLTLESFAGMMRSLAPYPRLWKEALACGRPLVATRVGGIPELVNENCGMLIPPADAGELRAALNAALSRQWDSEEIARSSTRSWESVAAETLAVCRKVCEAG